MNPLLGGTNPSPLGSRRVIKEDHEIALGSLTVLENNEITRDPKRIAGDCIQGETVSIRSYDLERYFLVQNKAVQMSFIDKKPHLSKAGHAIPCFVDLRNGVRC